LSSIQTLKTPYKFAPKLWKTITKSYKRFDKYLKTREKGLIWRSHTLIS